MAVLDNWFAMDLGCMLDHLRLSRAPQEIFDGEDLQRIFNVTIMLRSGLNLLLFRQNKNNCV